MLIRCPKCNVSYDIGAAAIPADGKKYAARSVEKYGFACLPTCLNSRSPNRRRRKRKSSPCRKRPSRRKPERRRRRRKSLFRPESRKCRRFLPVSKPRPKAFLNMRKICRRI